MKLPAISTIEFTNACNFSCSYCQRYDEDGKRKVGMISELLIDKLILERAFDNTLYVEFQQNGEPTMHPAFLSLVTKIRRVVPYIGMSTNGTFYKFKRTNSILEAMRMMDCITLSIHKETTQFDVDNMVAMLKGYRPKLRIQTLNKNTYGLELDKHWKDNGVFQDDYDIRIFGATYEQTKACLDPQASVTIQWDGDVVACCNVVGKQMVYGNVAHETLEDIWKDAPKTMFNYCSTCRTPSPYAKRLNFLAETLNS